MSDAHRFVVWGMDQRNEITDPNAQYSSAWTKVVKASDYDALAAENARLREALTRARDKIRECVTAGVLRHDLNVFLTKEWDGAPDQPSEHWPECSVCRRRHGPETQHPCE